MTPKALTRVFFSDDGSTANEVALKLRSEDSLKALEEPFNEMTEMLRLQAKNDQKAMEKLADEVEGHDNPVDAEMLRRLAEARGKTSE